MGLCQLIDSQQAEPLYPRWLVAITTRRGPCLLCLLACSAPCLSMALSHPFDVSCVLLLPCRCFCCRSFHTHVCCTASLRMQSDPANKDFKGISPERAYADFVLAGMVLFLAAVNYLG